MSATRPAATHHVQLALVLDDAHAFDHALGRDHGHGRERGTHLLRLDKRNAFLLEPQPMRMTRDKQVRDRPAEVPSVLDDVHPGTLFTRLRREPAVDDKVHAVLEREEVPLFARETGQIAHAGRSQREEGIHVRARHAPLQQFNPVARSTHFPWFVSWYLVLFERIGLACLTPESAELSRSGTSSSP